MKFLFVSILLSASAWSAVPAAHVELHSAGEKISGTVRLMPEANGLRIVSEVRGLKPNSAHGFHIHEKGKCEGPSYESAGAHFNPEKEPHGSPKAALKHTGDLGNLVADKEGVARKEMVIKGPTEQEIREIYGKAVIVHEKTDDLSSQPAGDSGKRLACGIIRAIRP